MSLTDAQILGMIDGALAVARRGKALYNDRFIIVRVLVPGINGPKPHWRKGEGDTDLECVQEIIRSLRPKRPQVDDNNHIGIFSQKILDAHFRWMRAGYDFELSVTSDTLTSKEHRVELRIRNKHTGKVIKNGRFASEDNFAYEAAVRVASRSMQIFCDRKWDKRDTRRAWKRFLDEHGHRYDYLRDM